MPDRAIQTTLNKEKKAWFDIERQAGREQRIIAINRFYRPDHSATSQLLTDLAEHLVEHGRDVWVITSRQTYDGEAKLPARETLSGVKIRRVWTTSFGRQWLPGRALDYITFHISTIFALMLLGRKADIVIAKTDPPLISVTAALACKLKRMRLVNWCQDLFPEVAAVLGVNWAKGWLGGLLRRLRNWSLRAAAINAVLHERSAERLSAQGLEASNIRVLPNWADRDIKSVPHEDNPLRREWGLDGRFVIGYSGNLGRAHMPEKVAELVRKTRDIEGLTWLFIGGGAGFDYVRAASKGANANVLFKPYQSRVQLSNSLSVPDMHLVSLAPACEGYILPSKLYGICAVKRPILFLGAGGGAIAQSIAGPGHGVLLDPENPSTWREQLLACMALHHTGSVNVRTTDLALCSWWSAIHALQLQVVHER